MADQYARMNTAQLEDEATQRGLNLEQFQSLRNNEERAQALRDHDAARDADAQTAQRNAEQAAQAQQQADQQAQTGSGQPQDQPTANGGVETPRDQGRQAGQGDVGPSDVAPYPSDESRQAAVDAASGNLNTEQSIDPANAPQVGGQQDTTDTSAQDAG